jgi:hypothetical protein
MSLILIVSSIVFIIGLTLFIIGLVKGPWGGEGFIAVGVLTCLFAIFCGFILFGITIKCGEPTIEYLTPEIAKSESIIFIKVDDRTIETKEHKYFLVNPNALRVKKVSYVNSYGVSLPEMIRYTFYIEGEKDLERKE